MSKQLFRSSRNKKIGGVCGGIAEYFDIDPVIVRVLFIVTTLCWGFGLLVYIILWIIVPLMPFDYEPIREMKSEPEEISGEPQHFVSKHSNGRIIGGVILIAVGVLILMDNVFTYFHFAHTWPILLIIVGVIILLVNPRSANNEVKK